MKPSARIAEFLPRMSKEDAIIAYLDEAYEASQKDVKKECCCNHANCQEDLYKKLTKYIDESNYEAKRDKPSGSWWADSPTRSDLLKTIEQKNKRIEELERREVIYPDSKHSCSSCDLSDSEFSEINGWNACLEECKRLNAAITGGRKE